MSTAELALIITLGVAAVLISCIAWLGVNWATWWLSRRWRIYCPAYPVAHLFDSADLFQYGLLDYTEKFVSPCTLNEVFVGAVPGRWVPKIQFMSMEMPDDFDTERRLKLPRAR